MTIAWRGALLAGCLWVAGCAGAPPASRDDAGTAPVWGDEYDGILIDTDLIDQDLHAAHRAFAADALLTPAARTLRATAALGPLSARLRESSSGRAGAAAFDTKHVSVVAGAVRASLGEGAVLADARDASSVEPRGTRSLDGLRVTPSSSTWGSALGAGVRLSLARVRIAAGAWRDRDDPADARAFVSALAVRGRGIFMTGVGQSRAGARVLSLGAAHATPDAFVSGEVGAAPDGVRVVARATVGADGAWRALLAAGTPGPLPDPAPATPGARWGAALERRGVWRGASQRITVSTRSRRDAETVERRQRVEWSSSWRASPASLEVGARATRESSWIAADVLEGAPGVESEDELRVRAALHAAESVAGGSVRADQTYRVEFVLAGAAPAGRVIAWTGCLRWRGADARVQASAFDLSSGQLAYAGRAALPGAATFTTLSRTGVDLSASLQVEVRGHVRVGAQAVWTAAGEARWAVQAGTVL